MRLNLHTPLQAVRSFLNTHPRAEAWLQGMMSPAEAMVKKPLFGCQSCGQCLLHNTGLVCVMRCPKKIRNGPCGGVRANGHCEVYPERACVWYRAYYQSQKLPLWREEMFQINRPVNWRLVNTSSWVNFFTGRDIGILPAAPPKARPAPVAPQPVGK